MSEQEFTAQQLVYDDFAQYVRDNIARDKNAKVQLTEFSNLRDAGYTHLSVPLQHVQTDWGGELHNLVKKFRKGAYLESESLVYADGIGYVAHIPWRNVEDDIEGRRNRRHGHRNKMLNAPSLLWLQLYIIALLLVGMAIFLTTTRADWYTVFPIRWFAVEKVQVVSDWIK